MRRSLAALLTAIAYRPDGARLAMIETLAAGPRAHERQRAVLATLAPYVDQGRGQTLRGPELPQSLSRVVIGGAAALIYEEVAAGRAGELRRLYPELLYFVLVPYIGHERALLEMRKARKRERGG
jgi:hypothetical protein